MTKAARPKASIEIERQIERLENLAHSILDLKRKAFSRRPIVIEFCGCPKSGKTSCINSLDIFLRRNGFRTKILTERASVCPIRNKFDPLFNIWTSCSALAQLSEMVANHSRDYDIIILDRGIFDALCWFEWERAEGYLRKDDLDRFASFFTALKWRSIIDIIFLFDATAEVSMKREYSSLLTRKVGSVMQPRVLDGYRAAIKSTQENYGRLFRSVLTINTSEMGQNDVSYEVTNKCLQRLLDVTQEKIGYLPVGKIDKLHKKDTFPFDNIRDKIKDKIEFGDRDLVEQNAGLLQPIPVTLVKDRTSFRFLIAKKRQSATSKDSPEKDRLLLYFGGHIRDEDAITPAEKGINGLFQQALYRELKEELGIDIDLGSSEPICIWVRRRAGLDKHIAMVYVVERDLDYLKLHIDEREFVRTKKDSTGSIMAGEELVRRFEELDDWSSRALEELYPTELKKLRLEMKSATTKNRTLFDRSSEEEGR